MQPYVDSVAPVHLPSLIRELHCPPICKIGLHCLISADSVDLGSDCADVQAADLELHCPPMADDK